jgi:hypothetical protein
LLPCADTQSSHADLQQCLTTTIALVLYSSFAMTLNLSIYYLKQVPEKPQLVGNLTKTISSIR